MHLGIGQEAISAALAVLLRPGDAVVSTHRPHLHALAHGVDPVDLLAELLERDGLCHGKGGHMHLFDAERRFMCTGIVGAGAPIAAGYALDQLREGGQSVTVAVLGDGAMNQGGVLRDGEPRRALGSAGGVPVRGQRLRDLGAARRRVRRGSGGPRGGVRHPGRSAATARIPHAVLAALEPAFARAAAARGAAARRRRLLPLPRALRGRRRHLPLPGREGGGDEPGARSDLPPARRRCSPRATARPSSRGSTPRPTDRVDGWLDAARAAPAARRWPACARGCSSDGGHPPRQRPQHIGV